MQKYQLTDGKTSLKQASIYNYKSIQPGSWGLYYMENIPKKIGEQTLSKVKVCINFF